MKLPEKLVTQLNKEAHELSKLIQIIDPQEIKNELAQKYINHGTSPQIVLQDGEFHLMLWWKDSKIIYITYCTIDQCIGFDLNTYNRFIKFIEALYKNDSINHKVSKNFILTHAFRWMVDIHITTYQEEEFVEYIEQTMASEIKEYCIHFPIHNFELNSLLVIGNIRIGELNEHYFKEIESKHLQDDPEEKEQLEAIKTKLLHKNVISCTILAEKEKAEEIAFERCSLLIDIFKIYSPVVDIPDYPVMFDIDSKMNRNQINQMFVQTMENPISIQTHYYPLFIPCRIGAEYLINMQKRGVVDFFRLFQDVEEKKITELESLIIGSIKRFSSALSMLNLHDRVVALFTILESLLLPNENAPISASLCMYLPKIVTKDMKQRKEIQKLIKSMYKVRCSAIHHGKEIELKIEELKTLQCITYDLLYQLLLVRDKHRSKKTLLEEIDEAIHQAY